MINEKFSNLRNEYLSSCSFKTFLFSSKKFSDNKISLDERDKIPLITNEDDIIWVVGFRSSRKFLKDKDTKEVIILKYGKNI